MKAVYPGSFDPIHAGHIDIARRASKIFGGITLLIADNPSKTYKRSSTDRMYDAMEILHKAGVNAEVKILPSGKMLGEWCKENDVNVIVKGLRNGADLESEFTQEFYTKTINENVETMYFSTNDKMKYLSSSSIKAFAKMPLDQFMSYMKKINYIQGLSDEDMTKYLTKIHQTWN